MKLVLFRLLLGLVLSAALVVLVWLDSPNRVANFELPPPPAQITEPVKRVLLPAENPPLENLEGGWVLNPVWAGFMGVAILFRQDGTFDYWFYSDVVTGREPRYPVSGRWKWNQGILELESEHHLYDTHWYVYQYLEQPALLPASARLWQAEAGESHEDRLLFRVPDFEPAQPFDS
jgi:hypothetical protein